MDPSSVSAGVLAASLFGQVAKSVGQAAGQEAGGALASWVRRRFAGRIELDEVEQVPDSPSRQQALGEAIDAELANDSGAADELRKLLEDVERDQPAVVQQAIGQQNIAANNSTLNVTFGSAPPRPQERLVIEWQAGDTYELVNRGTATAYGVDYTVVDEEGFMFYPGDATPDDLAPEEGLKFLAARTSGTTDDRLSVTWSNDADEQQKRRLRVPYRPDK